MQEAKTISSTLEKIGNETTGSTFDVIGKTEDVTIGIRFWAEQHAKIKHNTVISFRVRIAAVEGAPVQLNFHAFATSKFPKVEGKWVGKSSKHVSMLGMVGSKFPIWAVDKIVDSVVEKNLHADLVEYLVSKLEGVSWVLEQEQFKDYALEKILQALHTATHTTDVDPKAPGAVLQFGQGVSEVAHPTSFPDDVGDSNNADCGLDDGDFSGGNAA